MQRASRRRNAHALQRNIEPLLQPLRHLPHHLRYLADIIDLTVYHGALFVLRRLHVEYLEAVTVGLSDHTDHAASANVKRINQIVFLCFVFTHAILAPLYAFSLSLSMALKAP